MGKPLRAAVYTRISSDKEGRGLNVATQERDCREVCDSRGWSVVDVYSDNNKTAADPGKPREHYDRMMADVAKGLVDVIVVAKEDRLHRQPMELEHFVAACRQAGMAKLFSVKSGETDLSDSNALMILRIKGSVAANEVDRIRERVTRKKRALAESGSYGGGRRPFGYRVVEKKLMVDEVEAKVVNECAGRVLQGESLRSICRDLNERGIKPTRTGAWSTTSLRGMLLRPLMTGLRQYQGEVVGDADWDRVIDRDTHERLVAKLTAPERRSPRPSRTYVLRGILKCAECGHFLIATPRRRETGIIERNYSCRKDLAGCCGKMWIKAQPVEDFVLGILLPYVDLPSFRQALAGAQSDWIEEAKALVAAIAEDEKLKKELADDYYQHHQIDKRTFLHQTKVADARITLASDKLASLRGESVLDKLGGDIQGQWDSLSADDKRLVIESVVTEISVMRPFVRGRNRFDSDRVTMTLRFEAVFGKGGRHLLRGANIKWASPTGPVTVPPELHFEVDPEWADNFWDEAS